MFTFFALEEVTESRSKKGCVKVLVCQRHVKMNQTNQLHPIITAQTLCEESVMRWEWDLPGR